MKKEILDNTLKEIDRFKKTCALLLKKYPSAFDENDLSIRCKQVSAVKRASLDLSQLLYLLRNS